MSSKCLADMFFMADMSPENFRIVSRPKVGMSRSLCARVSAKHRNAPQATHLLLSSWTFSGPIEYRIRMRWVNTLLKSPISKSCMMSTTSSSNGCIPSER